jgi:hypothetical protein
LIMIRKSVTFSACAVALLASACAVYLARSRANLQRERTLDRESTSVVISSQAAWKATAFENCRRLSFVAQRLRNLAARMPPAERAELHWSGLDCDPPPIPDGVFERERDNDLYRAVAREGMEWLGEKWP